MQNIQKRCKIFYFNVMLLAEHTTSGLPSVLHRGGKSGGVNLRNSCRWKGILYLCGGSCAPPAFAKPSRCVCK